jgi:hypothetical protein
MSDEKEFPIKPPDPDNQLPAPEEPAGQLEPPSPLDATVIEMPAREPATESFEEPIPPAEEPRMTEDYVVTPPPPPVAPAPPEKKNNRTIWIVIIVVLVVLCCCCLVAIGLAIFGFLPFQDQIDYWSLLHGLGQFI